MPKRFCPECGNPADVFFRGFCKDCFGLRHTLVAVKNPPIRVEQCVHCSKVHYASRWLPRDDDRLRDLIEKRLHSNVGNLHASVTLKEIDEKKLAAAVDAIVQVDGQPLNVTLQIPVEWSAGQCDSCMRIRSDYFEAKLQVRFNSKNDPRLGEVHRRVLAYFEEASSYDSLSDIQAMGPVKNGFDYRIGSKKAAGGCADQLVREFNGQKVVSKKLHSFKDGRSEYRFTFLVRLPEVVESKKKLPAKN